MNIFKKKKGLAGLTLALGMMMGMATQADAAMIGNDAPYSGPNATYAYPFGEDGGSLNTIGQTFTVPTIDNILNNFTFNVRHISGDPTTFAGYVYAWDAVNNRATGPQLFASAPMTATAGVSTPFQVNTGNLALLSNSQYVAFFNASNFTNGIADTNGLDLFTTQTYSNGKAVYTQTGTNLSGVTTTRWTDFGTAPYDLRFTANFSAPTTAAVPEPGTMSLMGLGLAALGAARRKKKAAQTEAEETEEI